MKVNLCFLLYLAQENWAHVHTIYAYSSCTWSVSPSPVQDLSNAVYVNSKKCPMFVKSKSFFLVLGLH